MYIDTHCHLNFNEYDADRAMVIGNAKKAGVKQFINPGVDLPSSKETIMLAKKHPSIIFASVGIHPYEAQHDPDVSLLESLILSSRPKSRDPVIRGDGFRVKPGMTNGVVAIGECGLDYHQYKGEEALGKKDKQKRLFEEQLLLSLKYNLPVIMHCRDAYEDFFSVIDSLPTLPKGVIHCFSGGLQEIRMASQRKYYIGLDGNVTYSKQLELIVPSIPLAMILLETDAPYLTPVPHRGTRNEPKYIPLIANKIAQLHTVSMKKIENATTNNANHLFFSD